MLALAMGAARILGIGRNKALLDRVKALSPQRIEVYAVDEGVPVRPGDPLVAWAKSKTEGYGVELNGDDLRRVASSTPQEMSTLVADEVKSLEHLIKTLASRAQ